MRTGRPIAPLSPAVEIRESPERWARRSQSGRALAQRSADRSPQPAAVADPARARRAACA